MFVVFMKSAKASARSAFNAAVISFVALRTEISRRFEPMVRGLATLCATIDHVTLLEKRSPRFDLTRFMTESAVSEPDWEVTSLLA